MNLFPLRWAAFFGALLLASNPVWAGPQKGAAWQTSQKRPKASPKAFGEAREELEPLTVLPSRGGLVNGDFEAVRRPQGEPFPAEALARFYAGDESLGWRVLYGNVERISSADPGNSATADAWRSAASGVRFLDLNGSEPGAIRQTVATRPGQNCRVVFILSGNANKGYGDPATPALRKLAVWADPFCGGGGVFTCDVGKTSDAPGPLRWERRVFEFEARSERTELVFASLVPGRYGPTLDGVLLEEGEPDPAPGGPRGADYAMFLSPGRPTPEFEGDLRAFQAGSGEPGGEAPPKGGGVFPPVSDGRSDGADYGRLFTVAVSYDGRFRVMARRRIMDLDWPNSRYGHYQISIQNTATGERRFLEDLSFYWTLDGETGRQGLRQSFHWHPFRQVLLGVSETGRHWHEDKLWEVSDSGFREVPSWRSPQRESKKTGESEESEGGSLSIKGDVLERITRANPKVVTKRSQAAVIDPDEEGKVFIEAAHTYEHFVRWSGDEMIFRCDLNAWRTGKDADSGTGLDSSVEGRILYVPAKKGVPSHVRDPKIGRLPNFAR